jgi:hypothetical protein
MPVAAAVLMQWQQAVAELGPDADITTIVKIVERAAGVRIGPEEKTGG